MTDATHPDGAAARAAARLGGKRVALVAVIALAVVFIGASALQIVPAVFGARIRPLPAAPPGSDARLCADGVSALLRQLDSESSSPDEWERTARSCQGSPEGLDAWAALMRLRLAERQTSGVRIDGTTVASKRDQSELGPLRRDVAAHLPPELR
jgi:hypothetical protein